MYAWGIGWTGATLATRLRGLPNRVITNAINPADGWFAFWNIPVNTQPEFYEPPAFAPTLGLNFPYGYDVLPDAPV